MHRCMLWLFVVFSLAINHEVHAADGPIKKVSATVADVATEYREFEIWVDNKPMGIHSLSIKSDGGRHEVDIKSDVKVDLIVYAYVFKFRAKEIWRDGQVVFSDIHTEDGGKKRDFFYKSDGKTLQVVFNGKAMPSDAPGKMTTAYWMLPELDKEEQLRQKPFPILDVDTGNTRNGTVKFVTDSVQNCAGRSIACKQYKIEGPSPADVWFDVDHRLVRQKSLEQGHAMELRLMKIESSKVGK